MTRDLQDSRIGIHYPHDEDSPGRRRLAEPGEAPEVYEGVGECAVVTPVDYNVLFTAGETGTYDAISDYPCYRTVDGTIDTADDLVAAYPILAEKIVLDQDQYPNVGPTVENEEYLYVLKLTNKAFDPTVYPYGEKGKVFATCSLHAREFAPGEACTRFAEYLLQNYDTDFDVRWILDWNEIHLILTGNPDGRRYDEAFKEKWRKNRNRSPASCNGVSNYGIDLNRNFPFKWNGCVESTWYCSDDTCGRNYRGESEGSEQETKAIVEYGKALFPKGQRSVAPRDGTLAKAESAADNNEPFEETNTGVFLDMHSYGGYVGWSWSYKKVPPGNDDGLGALGRKMASYNRYRLWESWGYPADGGSKDYFYGFLGTAAMLMEIGTRFYEPCDYFERAIIDQVFPAMLYAAKVAKSPFITSKGPDILCLSLAAEAPVGSTLVASVDASDSVRAQHADDGNTLFATGSQNVAKVELYLNCHPNYCTTPTVEKEITDQAPTVTGVELPFDVPVRADTHVIYVRAVDSDGYAGPVTARSFVATACPSTGCGGVALFANTLLVGAPLHNMVLVFTYDGDSWKEMDPISIATDGISYNFGASVALYGDFAVIGAPGTESGAHRGSVYLYKRFGETWENTYLIGPEIEPRGRGIGSKVSLFEDTVLISAGRFGDPPDYVYSFIVYRLNQEGKISTEMRQAVHYFPGAISLSKDTFALGDPEDSNEYKLKTGSVHVYSRDSSGVWSEEAKLFPAHGTTGDDFGYSISLDTDGAVALVGAPNSDNYGIKSGSAYIFRKNGHWKDAIQTNLRPRDGAGYNHFGKSVSLYEGTALIASPGDGSVDFFDAKPPSETSSLSTTTPPPVCNDDNMCTTDEYDVTLNECIYTLIQCDGEGEVCDPFDGECHTMTWQLTDAVAFENDNRFGESVSLHDRTALIGARKEDNWFGRVHVRNRNVNGDWETRWYLLPNARDGLLDLWGASVALFGATALVGRKDEVYFFSYNGNYWVNDGDPLPYPGIEFRTVSLHRNLALVGDHSAERAYIFARDDENGWVEKKILTPPDGVGPIYFGSSVAIDERHAFVGSGRGFVYCFELIDNDWVELPTLSRPDVGFGEHHESISLSGNFVLIGADRDKDTNGVGTGSAYLYEKRDNAWVEVGRLLPADGEHLGYFGYSVSLFGDTALIGARNTGGGELQSAGAAYIFQKEGSWNEARQERLHAPNEKIGSMQYFGHSVSLYQDTAVVGAFGSSTAYIFDRVEPGECTLSDTIIEASRRVGTQDALSDPLTPQSLARDWLFEQYGDGAVISCREQHFFEQRYALVTMYYSFGGDNSSLPGGRWLASLDYCGWSGLKCDLSGNVVQLRLGSEDLAGQIPPEVGLLADLEYFKASSNELDGTLPNEISLNSIIRHIDLSGNNLSGPIPAILGELEVLEYLDLSSNAFSGSIPPDIFPSTSSLKHFDVSGNALSGTLPSEIGNCQNLETVLITYNNLHGSIPTSFGDLVSLVQLNLSGDGLTGTIPPKLFTIDSLRDFNAQQNSLSGKLPPEIRNLRRIGLPSNQISGSVPTYVGRLTSFGLDHNRMSGTIPPEIFAPDSPLRSFTLASNGLTGVLPSEIGLSNNLSMLSLERNKLSGTIPPSLWSMESIFWIQLDGNDLTGTVPEVQANQQPSADLWYLFLHHNELTGQVPQSVCDLGLGVLTTDCGGSSPEIACDCCAGLPASSGGEPTGCYE